MGVWEVVVSPAQSLRSLCIEGRQMETIRYVIVFTYRPHQCSWRDGREGVCVRAAGLGYHSNKQGARESPYSEMLCSLTTTILEGHRDD